MTGHTATSLGDSGHPSTSQSCSNGEGLSIPSWRSSILLQLQRVQRLGSHRLGRFEHGHCAADHAESDPGTQLDLASSSAEQGLTALLPPPHIAQELNAFLAAEVLSSSAARQNLSAVEVGVLQMKLGYGVAALQLVNGTIPTVLPYSMLSAAAAKQLDSAQEGQALPALQARAHFARPHVYASARSTAFVPLIRCSPRCACAVGAARCIQPADFCGQPQ